MLSQGPLTSANRAPLLELKTCRTLPSKPLMTLPRTAAFC